MYPSALVCARHRLLEAFVLRLARRPEAPAFALRGGMRVRQLFPSLGRPALDLDLVCSLPFELASLRDTLQAILTEPVSDGIRFDPERLRLLPIWQDTPAPGLRVSALGEVDGQPAELRADVTFGLRPWPEPGWEEFVGERGRARLRMCKPESIVGRKLQVIAGLGQPYWRPKDLNDVRLMLGQLPLQPHVLGEALEASLEGCAESLQDVREAILRPSWWAGPRAGARWQHFLKASGGQGAPADLASVIAEVRSRLSPVLESR
jgi:hypothetical protein